MIFKTTQDKITHILKTYRGVDYVLDTQLMGDIALIESAHDFLNRYKNRQTYQYIAPQTSLPINSSESLIHPNQSSSYVDFHGGNVKPQLQIPMMSSSCPGWICFIEKSHPEVIPFISTVKSAQQIAGVLIKLYISNITGVPPEKIYHVAVMPCADKKIEALRKNFLHKDNNTYDVDCVLTTKELKEILQSAHSSPIIRSKIPNEISQVSWCNALNLLKHSTHMVLQDQVVVMVVQAVI